MCKSLKILEIRWEIKFKCVSNKVIHDYGICKTVRIPFRIILYLNLARTKKSASWFQIAAAGNWAVKSS